MTDLLQLEAPALRDRIRSGEVSAREVCRTFLERIDSIEDQIGAFLTLRSDEALKDAAKLDERITRGEDPGSLAGLPIAVKDIISTRGIRTTCASRLLEDFVPTYDATVIDKLKQAGAILVGKTNMDEFAMGSSTENSAFHPTHNPYDLERVPGGSSGGSAAILAADGVPLALGTDTGGSIRQPAALCGIVGLKPTYGRVSRYGLVAFASSLDQIGPMGRSVADVAMLLGHIAGPDPRDSTASTREPADYLAGLDRGVEGLRIGIPTQYFPDSLDGEIGDRIRAALETLEGMGARLEEISLPHTRYAVPTYYIVAPAEASSNLARYDGVRYGFRADPAEGSGLGEMYTTTRNRGFGPEVKRRIMLGTYVLSAGYYDAYYLKAQKVRTLIREDFRKAFRSVDLICSPTTPTTAFRIGEKKGNPLEMYHSDVFTATINLAGLPALSLPCGISREGLPIGIQIIGRPFEEQLILMTGRCLEENLHFRENRPRLAVDH